MGEEVPLQVVHTEKRDAKPRGIPLGVGKPYEKRAKKSGAESARDEAHVLRRHLGLSQGLRNEQRELAKMVPGRDLRNDPPERRMDRCLGVDEVHQQLSVLAKDCDRGLVTRALDP
jgi:hypothetical protein